MTRRDFAAVVAFVIFIIWVVLFWDYAIDDAFITFRYAEHLANGHGLVFNIGDKPIEGYSNFLWLLLLTGLYKIGLITVLAAKIAGVVSTAITGALWYFYFRNDRSRLLWLVGPLYLICPIAAFWAVSGLELGLHTLLLTLLFLTAVNRSKLAWIVLPFFVLSRPESVGIALVLIGAVGLFDWIKRRTRLTYHFISVAVAVVTLAMLTLFRLQVFGYPLPNTFYAKTHYANNGLFELGVMLIWLLPLAVTLIWAAYDSIKSRFSDEFLTVTLVLFLVQAIVSSGVDPVMNFWFRYMTPFLPLLLILGLSMVGRVPEFRFQAVYVALIALSLVSMTLRLHDFDIKNHRIIEAQTKLIDWAKPLDPNTRVSMTDMGLIPYETNIYYNDLWGLTDFELAHKGFNSTWEFLHMPDYFIFVGYMDSAGPELRFWRERTIAYTEHFFRCYNLVTTFSPDGLTVTQPGYHYLVFRRRADAGLIVDGYGREYWEGLLQGKGKN